MEISEPRTVNPGTELDICAEIVQIYEANRQGSDVVRLVDGSGFWEGEISSVRLALLWRALKGDTAGQREVAWWFDGMNNEEVKDGPNDQTDLAAKWYAKAARCGDVKALCNLSNIYCSSDRPLWNGPLAVELREEATARGEPHSMKGLAFCLECGNCCKWDGRRAAKLKARAERILKERDHAGA